MIVALALSPSLDITYQVPQLRTHEITRPTAIARVAGGKALNMARVAATLRAPVHAVVALGGHQGNWVAELLADDGIEATVVPLRHDTRSCITIVEATHADSSTDLYEQATELDPDEWDAFANAATQVADHNSHRDHTMRFVLSGSLPAGVRPDAIVGLLQSLRDRGAWVAVDSSGAGLRACAPHCDLVKINRAEARELLGADTGSAPGMTARDAAHAIATGFDTDAVVTDGARGGFAVFGGSGYPLSAPTEAGRFPAGSGDAFLGGLVAALHQGLDPADALHSARLAAERNAAVPGQGILAPR